MKLPPDALPTPRDPGPATLFADAQRYLALQGESLAAETRLIGSRVSPPKDEIVTLMAKHEALGRQKTLAEEHLSVTKSLAERGLAANARLLDA